jgi:hypothetical protein
MLEGKEKLEQDLKVLEAMAEGMDEYLKNQSLFWPLPDTTMPRLTVGGYLSRQHRLVALRQLLEPGEQQRLDDAIRLFNEALVEKVVAFEKRANDELHARLRQWSEYIRELGHESLVAGDYYASAVETRAIIAALLDKLSMPPYELDKGTNTEAEAYDKALRNYWRQGDFAWPEDWQNAYPANEYWWLYGHPLTRS